MKTSLKNLQTCCIDVFPGDRIFFYGEVWAGKTTLIQYFIKKLLKVKKTINSPTYGYYNTYENIVHFDLYRIEKYEDFIRIGWEEILDTDEYISFIEWPEVIEKKFSPTVIVKILHPSDYAEDEREISIVRISDPKEERKNIQ